MEEFSQTPELVKFLRNVATNNLKAPNFELKSIQTNAKGEGYLGKIWIIHGSDLGSGKTVDLVIKSALPQPKVREMFPIKEAFLNEIVFYDYLLPLYRKMCADFNFAPRCFGTSVTDESEMIALENIKLSGFELFEKTQALDHRHVELIFATYGKVHAFSFALKQKQPRKFQEIVDKTRNIYNLFLDKGFAEVMSKNFNPLTEELAAGREPDFLSKFQKYLGGGQDGNLDKTFRDAVGDSKFNTLLHGDCWSNNMMFKYDANRNPVDIKLLDFQLIKLGSPACDLAYFFYAGGSKEVFDKLDDYLQLYYSNFVAFLKKLGGNPEEAFTLADLKEEWSKFAKFGFIMALSLWKMKFAIGVEEVRDLTDYVDDPDYEPKVDHVSYVARINEIIDNMLAYDAL